MRRHWVMWGALLGACGDDGAAPVDAAVDVSVDAPLAPFSFEATKVGAPGWVVADIAQFSAPIGTTANGHAEFAVSIVKVFNKHSLDAQNIWSTVTPHAGPYTSEARDGAIAAGFPPTNTFAAPAWTEPAGAVLTIVVAADPSAPVGQTPDGMLPMIPKEVFPISSDLDLVRGTTIIDPSFDGADLFASHGGGTNAGLTHFIVFIGESTEFVMGQTTGTFHWTMKIRDKNLAGWDVTAGPFEAH